MKPQDVRVSMLVKVLEHHRIEQRRGLLGKVVGRSGEKSTWWWTCALRTASSGCSGRRTWRRSPHHAPGGAPFLATKARASEMEELRFPKFGYYLDESDPDVAILRRQDGSFVAPFSARGATKEGIKIGR